MQLVRSEEPRRQKRQGASNIASVSPVPYRKVSYNLGYTWFDIPRRFLSTTRGQSPGGLLPCTMPFAPELKPVFETICAVIETEPWNFVCRRAGDFFAGGHILADILQGIREAEIVIADLSDRNPNVFYELGIAHMVKNAGEVPSFDAKYGFHSIWSARVSLLQIVMQVRRAGL